MDRIGKIFRSTIETEFKRKLTDMNGLFVVKCSGLKASEFTKLRSNLSQNNSKLFVTKNSLAARVLKEMKLAGLVDYINGQTAFIFGYDDPILICKIISKFSKEHAALEFQGGILENRLVAKTDIVSLSAMLSKDELRAKFVLCVKGPINNLVFVLSNIIKKPIYALNAIKDKKQEK